MIFGVAERAWIKIFVIMLAAGLGCAHLSGATNGSDLVDTPPAMPGSIQWDINRQIFKERQELYRKRVPLPNAVTGNVPVAAGANLASRRMPTPEPPAAGTSSDTFIKRVLFFVLFTLIGILAVRRFAPYILHDLNQQLNPWAAEPVYRKKIPAKILAEETALGEFLKDLQTGPNGSQSVDSSDQNDAINVFCAWATKLIKSQQKLLQEINQESREAARQKMLANLFFEISSLKGEAGFTKVLPVWQMASALEGLLKQLLTKRANVTPSTLRTVAGGLELLKNLCVKGLKPDLLADRPFKFLVVDDDMISRQALSLALKKAFSEADLAVDGKTALVHVCRQTYDVIFLDVQMPGMDGFELCLKIHETVPNRATPVVFVTGLSDFNARTKATLSGGSELMGKPFLIFEVTVKALTLALRGRLLTHTREAYMQPKRNGDQLNTAAAFAGLARPVNGNISATKQPVSASPPIYEVTRTFLSRTTNQLGPLRKLCQTILQNSNETTRQNLLANGFLRINSLISDSSSEVVHPAYHLCIALEGLFRKLLENVNHTTPSTLATVGSAVDLLADLCAPSLKPDLAINPPFQMLVVDDDLIARRIIVGALQTAFFRPESVEDGETALALTGGKSFDVIFLDVVMPGMDGLQVCTHIRNTVLNHATPVVFVTAHDDFDTRAQMIRNGGNDIMGKPFLTSEITVKALTFALRIRLQQQLAQNRN